jgi:hypothetical protein
VLTVKTEYRFEVVGELVTIQPAPSQRKTVPEVPTAHPWVGEERKTPRKSFVASGVENRDHAPVGQVPDHLKMLGVPRPTAQPSMPLGSMKTEYKLIPDGIVTATQEIPSQWIIVEPVPTAQTSLAATMKTAVRVCALEGTSVSLHLAPSQKSAKPLPGELLQSLPPAYMSHVPPTAQPLLGLSICTPYRYGCGAIRSVVPSRVGFKERHCESCADAGRILEAISIVITATVKATSLLFRFNIPSNTFHHS